MDNNKRTREVNKIIELNSKPLAESLNKHKNELQFSVENINNPIKKKQIMESKSIIFADLDGTLIETKSGKTFPQSIMDMQFKEDVLIALKKHFDKIEGYKALFIVSNQGGIEKEIIREENFEAKLSYICLCIDEFLGYNVHVSGTFCSTNDPKNGYRKPNTYMLEALLRPYRLKNKENIFMIGDASGKEGQFSDSDKKCAENFGIDYLDVDDFVELYNK
ncbi:MAG: HAD-IIIA family hydrolase [Bacteroidales bacterium]